MSNFADVEQFSREHTSCGGITPRATPQPGGGFLLTLTCACGTTFDRWVTMEEAKQPLPLPRAARAAPRPAPAPSADLEAVMRAAVEAETAYMPPPAPPPSAPPAPAGDLDAVMREALAAESKPVAPPRPTSPAKLNLDKTIRTALTQQDALSTKARRGKAKPRTRVAWLVLFTLLAVGVAATVYFAGVLDAPPEAPVVAKAPPPPPPDQQQRAAFDEIMKSLRVLQAASSPNASLSVYSSRVVFAKADLERFMPSTAPGPGRAAVREVLDIHLLAAAAWKARTLEQKDAWEAIGQDAAIDLCPSVKRVVDFATQPENLSRAQARGVAVASAIPLLWECAGAKIEAIERGPAAPAAAE